jgi:predicted oxidoreductase
VSHYDTSREHIFNSVDASLKNMATDYLDLLLIHRQDPFLDHHETGKALDDIIKSGKVKEVGVSNFKSWDFTLLQSAMKSHLVTNQIEMSLAATDSFTNGDLAFHQERATTIMAWSPLGGGKLMKDKGILGKALKKIAVNQNVDIAAVAVAWLLAHPARICPVMGTNNLNRIAKISDAMNVKMDRESWFELYTASFNDGKLQWRLP